MSQPLVYILLACALVLPTLGALTLRVLGGRLTLLQLYSAAAGVFALALVSVLLLARSDVPSLQIGRLSILLPVSAPGDFESELPVAELPTSPPPDEPAATAGAATSAPPTSAPSPALEPTAEPTDTPEPTAEPTAAPTAAPTNTPEPTAAPTNTPEPPTAAPAGPRTYVVQPGDTLRSIAEQFGVSVQAIIDANRLTPEQADSLRVGQELVIP